MDKQLWEVVWTERADGSHCPHLHHVRDEDWVLIDDKVLIGYTPPFDITHMLGSKFVLLLPPLGPLLARVL